MTDLATVSPALDVRPQDGPYRVDTSAGGHDGSVSRQWFSRPADQCFASLDALHAFKKTDWMGSFEFRQVSRDFELFAPDRGDEGMNHDLMVGINKVKTAGSDVVRSVQISPTHYAFGQLCGLAGAPAKYLRTLDTRLVSDNLNYGLQVNREVEELKVYGDLQVMKAATGPDYGRIPDFEVVDALRKFAGDGLTGRWKTPGKINWSNGTYDPNDIGDGKDRTFYGSDRDCFVFLVDDKNPICIGKTKEGFDDLIFRGIIVENSEVGTRSLKVRWFYLRGICMNRNLWGVEKIEEIMIRHTRLAPDRWLQEAAPAIRHFAESSSAKLIDGVNKAKEAVIAETEDKVVSFLKNRKFSASAIKGIIETSKREEDVLPTTAWSMAQGITAYARSIPNTDARLQMELEAKAILDKVA